MKRLACLLSLWAACLAALAESALPERDLYALPLDELLRVQTPAQAEVGSRTGARSALEASGGLEKLRLGFARRQWRKLKILARTWVWGHAGQPGG